MVLSGCYTGTAFDRVTIPKVIDRERDILLRAKIMSRRLDWGMPSGNLTAEVALRLTAELWTPKSHCVAMCRFFEVTSLATAANSEPRKALPSS